MKREFVRLEKLVDIDWGGTKEQQEAWVQTCVEEGVAEDGYTYASTADDADYDVVELDEKELDSTDEVVVYDIMGGEHEEESFYERDCVVYKHKKTGVYYIDNTDDLGAF